MLGADGVMMGDRPAPVDDRAGGRGLHPPPAHHRFVELGTHDGEVQRRAGRVDVRDVAHDHPGHILGGQRRGDRVPHPGVQAGQGRPEPGRLQGLGEHPGVQQGVAQVRAVKAAAQPLGAGIVPQRGRPGGTQQLADLGPARGDPAGPALVPDDQMAAAGGGRAGAAEPGRGLHLVRQARDRRQQIPLRQDAQHRGRAGEARQAPALVVDRLGQRTHPQPYLGDDPESSFGAEHEFAQIGSGRGGGRPAELPGADRGREPDTDDHAVEPAVTGGGLATGPGRGEPPDGRVLPRLRQVTESETVCGKRGVEGRTAQTGISRGQL